MLSEILVILAEMNQKGPMPILFNSESAPFGAFSNFFKGHPIEIDGRIWPTTEHYFQAMKFPDHPEIQEEIRACRGCQKTKTLANKTYGNLYDQTAWAQRCNEVMLTSLRAKFTQHRCLRDLLLLTGNEPLAEHCRDDYWGDGLDGHGQNTLGQLLMQVRMELREAGEVEPRRRA